MVYKNKESETRVLDAAKRGRDTMKKKEEERKALYYKNPKKCKKCKSVIDYYKQRNDFCSHSCGAIYNNLSRTGNLFKIKIIKEKKYCKKCSKEIPENRFFCSDKCFKQDYTDKKIKLLESDAIVSVSFLRRYLLNKYNNSCELCGWGKENPVSKTVCLDLHHIDGNSKNTRLSNAQILCPNCHSLTPNYKRVGSKNRKSTRIRK